MTRAETEHSQSDCDLSHQFIQPLKTAVPARVQHMEHDPVSGFHAAASTSVIRQANGYSAGT